ncbi:FusB/FusC family EF-G-binding protein [Gracilibacillus caseinilyticus]|uniref:FusB/FusC family EF-G-binding protein n=1 Tax=Gracilibacillus caseinilyticus TaxID=2932256 RepID=A0ABY4EXD5_9BACI|nr:FusB/FusC family EF-G-binding protein [Gracilibacillus caseinilyticus]UOQ49073.1 FusB/FusC family EF-G-binding protein [Gracilibacillus caseinilyticus]
MESFLYPDQYHHIEQQLYRSVSAHAISIDQDVIQAVQEMAQEEIERTVRLASPEQKQLLANLSAIQDQEDMQRFLQQLKQHVIPFPLVSDKQLEKAFPKIKKLHTPDIDQLDRKEMVYWRWVDKGSGKTCMLIPKEGKFTGIEGYQELSQQKGVCSICNGLEEVSLFTVKKKGQMRGMYSKKGNYICKDPDICNKNITNIEYLYAFVDKLNA